MLTPHAPDIQRFVSHLFRYADEGTFISLRAFDQFDSSKSAIFIEPVALKGDLHKVVTQAVFAADRAANGSAPAVFAPPVATFTNPNSAATDNLANGVALSVEIDSGDQAVALSRLQGVLGPYTIAMQSGGEWIDPETGEIHPKHHVHWRLSEPTRNATEHGRLQYARAMGAKLVGGDYTAAPPVHPLRWPGSWNTKAKPRIARIVGGNEAAEIHLDYAIERLEEAIEALGLTVDDGPREPGKPQAPLSILASALTAMVNEDVHWEEWNRIGMAAYRASGGSAEGLSAWCEWSAKSPKHDEQACSDRWKHFDKSPPSRIGAGTIFFHAAKAGWVRPEREMEEPPDWTSDPGYFATIDQGAHLETADMEQIAQDVARDIKAETVRARKEQLEREYRDNQAEPLPLLWFDDIKPVLEAKDFVQGVLIEEGAVVVYGQSNAGKTFWATDLALHVAAGDPWGKRRVEKSGVVYCVLEGGNGFRNRVSAWKASRGLEATSLPFVAIPSGLNLLSPDGDTSRLIAAIKAAAAMISVPVRLVVIDTLARAMAGGNENASEDMGALVVNMDAIRTATKACVMFIHHSGKDQAKGARGHSSLQAAIDTEIEVVAEDGSAKTATVVKQREMRKGDVFPFTLRVIELGANQHGEAVTTCLVDYGENQAPGGATDRSRRLKGHTKRALEVLADLVNTSGQAGHAGTPAGALSVPDKWWRERFYERAMPGAEPEARKKAFQRASTDLLNAHAVGFDNGRVWIPSIREVPKDDQQ